jgi:hypothetical protein
MPVFGGVAVLLSAWLIELGLSRVVLRTEKTRVVRGEHRLDSQAEEMNTAPAFFENEHRMPIRGT